MPTTRRRAAALTAGACVLALAPHLTSSAHAAATSDSGNILQGGGLPPVTVPGLAPLGLKGQSDLGAAQPSAAQTVTVVLTLRDQAGLKQLLHDQATPGTADYEHWLTPAEFAARYAPAQSAVDAVAGFARTAGLAVGSVSSNRTLVQLSGTTAQINKAFGIVEQTATAAGQTFLNPDRTATLPTALAGVTTSVLGLSTFQANSTPLVHRSSAATPATSPYQQYPLGSYGPKDFWQIYDAPTDITGSGQKVAVITSGDLTQVGADLATFEATNGLPTVPLQVVQTEAASTDVTDQDEYDLDTQYSSGFAPGVSAVVAYNGTSLGDIAPLNAWATDDAVKTASASYGGCELLDELGGSLAADDQVFMQADAQGQTMFVSSGDAGSDCSVLVNAGAPVGVPDVEYPSSSPYVVSVGGTTLTGQSTQPLREISWIGGGGGYSTFEAAPSWQTANLVFQPALGRGLPDVSLDADSNSGYNVIVSGTSEPIGGTSASTPSWNGIWARVLQAHPDAGFAAPKLYAAKSGLVDITLGANGTYTALPGYDLTTGLGTADITKLIAAIS